MSTALPPISPEDVAARLRAQGFSITAEEAARMAPTVEDLLGNARHSAQGLNQTLEPATIFAPARNGPAKA